MNCNCERRLISESNMKRFTHSLVRTIKKYFEHHFCDMRYLEKSKLEDYLKDSFSDSSILFCCKIIYNQKKNIYIYADILKIINATF